MSLLWCKVDHFLLLAFNNLAKENKQETLFEPDLIWRILKLPPLREGNFYASFACILTFTYQLQVVNEKKSSVVPQKFVLTLVWGTYVNETRFVEDYLDFTIAV